MKKKSVKFSPEVIQRGVRMVCEAKGKYESQWVAIVSIAPKIGCTTETLRRWVRQHEGSTGKPTEAGSADEQARIKALVTDRHTLEPVEDRHIVPVSDSARA